MRQSLVLALLILFTANTTLAAAWARPCMHDMQNRAAFAEWRAAAESRPPCHDRQSHDRQTKWQEQQHCDGVCLCAHVAVSPTLYLNASEEELRPSMAGKQLFLLSDDALVSISQIPPRRPPKRFS